MKIEYELRAKTYCTGCGIIGMVSGFLPPADFRDDDALICELNMLKNLLEQWFCEVCDSKVVRINFFPDVTEKIIKKKKKGRRVERKKP